MKEAAEALYQEEYFEYLYQRNSFRKFIRQFYLKNIARFCIGKTIDFGCGIGNLLHYLPQGSMGLEINPVAVAYCQQHEIPVSLYHPSEDQYNLSSIEPGVFKSFTMNHVLEHLDESYQTIEKLFETCHRLEIERIVFTVPGKKGFDSDKTHMTFIDRSYFEKHGLFADPRYRLRKSYYFPFNTSFMSRFFVHNELRLIFDKR